MQQGANEAVERLAAFVGEWNVEASLQLDPPGGIRGRTVFEWMPGERFLVQRWKVGHPDAPDGIAIIGFDQVRQTYLQHYFDSRGVARVYEMTFGDGVWTLERNSADFSPLDFRQRFTATFGEGGKTIDGRWETSDDGVTWERDFDLIYTKPA